MGYHDTGDDAKFRGATFMVADLRGAKFIDCDMTDVKIVDACLMDVDISGYVRDFVINGVDVTEFVNSELDRRHPERVQLRQVRTADDFRAMWDTIERLWSNTIAHAEELAEPARHERICTRTPAPGYPEEPRPVGDCLGVVMEEECEHHRFAARDLAKLA